MSTGNQSIKRRSLRKIGKDIIDRFKHEKFSSDDRTRLLLLWPRKECLDGAIHATLTEVKFADLGHVKFSALSYHWGKMEDQHVIRLHNKGQKYESMDEMTRVLQRGKFRVRSNLHAALETFQSNDQYRLLWIDVICINQDDPDEKQQQLANISQVYEKANTVLIWLGPSNERRMKAIEFVKRVVNLANVRALATNSAEIDNWGCLVELMQLSWFSRRWVIQELALARKAVVYCGRSEVDWDDLRDAISLMARYMEEISFLFKDSKEYDNNYYALGDIETLDAKVLVDTIHNLFRRNKLGVPFEPVRGLEYLVSTLSTFQSADPRDTINALRSIAKESTGSKALKGENEPPKPDYDPHKTLSEIYIDFVQWVYKTSGRIDILCRKWALPEKESRPKSTYSDNYPCLSELPSWIQVVSRPREMSGGPSTSAWRMDGESFVGAPNERPYNASFSVPADVTFPRTLRKERSQDGQRPPNDPQIPRTPEEASNPWAGEKSQPTTNVPKFRRISPEIQELQEQQHRRERQNAHYRSMLPGLEEIDVTDIAEASESGITILESPTEASFPSERTIAPRIDTSIRVTGIQIGKISMRTDRMAEEMVHATVVESLTRGTELDCPDKLWRGLVAEWGAAGRNRPATYQRACRLILRHHASRSGHINTRELLTRGHGVSDVEKEYLKRVQAVICNRVFFEATQTPEQPRREFLQGFGPGDTKIDDVVCILFGCSVLVILRRTSDFDHFSLIGECYVYGQMDGDAISSLGEGLESQKRQFRII